MTRERITRRRFVQDSAAVAAAAAVGASAAGKADAAAAPDPTKTRSYNENMKYRRLGQTNLMISVVSIGGHWKKIPYRYNTEAFHKNRRDVLSACMDHGINYIDACWDGEVIAYGKAIRGRRDKIFFGFSFGAHESRFKQWGSSLAKMKEGFEIGLKAGGLDHVDLWRITMHEQTSRRNTPQEIEIAMEVLDWAKKSGKARFTGVSTHDRPWAAEAVAKYPQLEVIVTPYHAKTKQKAEGSMFDALRQHDVGMIGIKPFASGSIFKSRGVPDSATKEEDDEIARLTLRRNLASCDVLTACIPGLITVDQVANAAAAVKEPLALSRQEDEYFQQVTKDLWDRVPKDYQWLRDWEWV